MRGITNKILALIALCGFNFQCSTATLNVSHVSLNYPDYQIEFTPGYFIDEKLVYALCDKNNQTEENNCTLVQRSLLHTNISGSCNITLKPEHKEGRLGPKIEIAPFGNDKAILIYAEWGKESYIRISTVQFSTCKIEKMKVYVDEPFFLSLVFVIPYQNSFDIIFENSAVCDRKKCKITIDKNGKNVTQVIGAFEDLFGIPTPLILPLSKSSPNQDLFFVRRDESYSKTFHILKSDGTEKNIAKYKFSTKMMITSATNQLIGVCYRDSSTANITCTQHDAEGNLKMETVLVNSNNALGLRKLYNLPNGGLLLLAAECEDKSKGKLNFFVTKVDSAGKKVGSFDIKEFQCNLFEDEAGDSIYYDNDIGYCIALTCRQGDLHSKDKNQRYLNVTTNCFTDADFTN